MYPFINHLFCIGIKPDTHHWGASGVIIVHPLPGQAVAWSGSSNRKNQIVHKGSVPRTLKEQKSL